MYSHLWDYPFYKLGVIASSSEEESAKSRAAMLPTGEFDQALDVGVSEPTVLDLSEQSSTSHATPSVQLVVEET